jgi:hypothetical protein
MATVSIYPDPSNGGPLINRLVDMPPEHQRNVIKYEYEDGGCDVNVQPCSLKKWQLDYEGLTTAEMQAVLDHFNLAKGRVNTFPFFHARIGVTYAGVSYADLKIGKHPKKWVGMLQVTLQAFI